MVTKKEFLHRDLKKIFPSISPRTLIYWVERGLISPTIKTASGRGTARKYSYGNLIEIACINELLCQGLPFSRIKFIVESQAYRSIIEGEKWDSVLWLVRRNGDHARGDDTSFYSNFGSSSFEDFFENALSSSKGGELAFRVGKADVEAGNRIERDQLEGIRDWNSITFINFANFNKSLKGKVSL